MTPLQTVYSRRAAMCTLFEVFLAGDDAQHLEAVAVAVLDEVSRLERLLSRFDPAGEIARINREAARRPVRLDYEVWDILCRCEEYRRATGGCFDVTAASSYGQDAALVLDLERRSIRFDRPDIFIDLGGFGKGYALDCVADILRRFHVASALVNGGTSSILALGRHPNGKKWPTAVRGPAGVNGTTPVSDIGLADQGFSCSAVFAPGQTESDLIAPHRGQPLTDQAACVVVAPDAAEAEVLSTACLVMGKERARKYLQVHAQPGRFVGWIDADNGSPRLEWLKETP